MLALLTAAALAALALAAPVAAGGHRWTMGDANAMLQSYGAAGDVVFQRLYPGLDIRPSQEFYGDVKYCVEDWHLVALLWEDAEFTVPNGPVRTRKDVVDFLSGLQPQFTLDGLPVNLRTTPIKVYRDSYLVDYWVQFLAQEYGPGVTLKNLWAVQWGQPIAPEALAVGEHTLAVVVTDRESDILFDQQLVFEVHGSNSPACTTP